ncbi:unnamed protein product, partial [Mesorhabditis belari]|uniref:Uncharacterized protein n=1 Tax=Mesorhabditis belari TaxID=2138241 RepID=A0AAF3EJM9_9BILA
MWAANGIACVLAARGYMNEARDVFSQVREATADFMDVWINIAHVYTEQKQYVAAVQMYSSAIKRFGCENNTTLLLYLARAYFLAGMHLECRDVLEKILLEQPENLVAKFNYAFVTRKVATTLLRDDKSSLEQVNGACADLKTAERMFTWMAQNRDETYLFTKFVSKTSCAEQGRGCSDVIKQSGQYIARAQKKDESERHLRLKQEEEREALRQRILAERKAREEEEAMKKEELAAQRKIYMQMTKDLLKMPEVAQEEKRSRKEGGGGGGRGRKRKGEEGEEFVNDSSDMGDWRGEGGEGGQMGEKRKKKASGKKRREKKEPGESDGDSDDREERRRRKKERAAEKAEAKLSAKQQAKIKSRAYLSSESESSDEGAGKKQAAASASEESPPPPAFDDSDSAESQASATVSRAKKKRAVMSDSDSNESSKGNKSDDDED